MMTALGINIYGGGFTLGVQNHFKVLGQWEECTLGKKTFDLNFKNIYRPLKLEEWPVKDYISKVEFLYANPPCRPWSNASVTLGRTNDKMFFDKRLVLTEHTMSAALKIKPLIFMSESVENTYIIGVSHYNDYAKMWIKAGYHVTYFLNDAIIQGAPCVRRRFHFIASRYKLQIKDKPIIKKVTTVRDAIGNIIKTNTGLLQHEYFEGRKGFTSVMSKVPPYGGLKRTINTIPNWEGNQCSFLIKRLAWDFPACTMVGFEYIHPDGHRWITFREALRLCGYPDTFSAHNAVEAVDAVIPPVAEFLSITAKKTLQKTESVKPGLSVIDWRPYAKQYHFSKDKL